MAGPNDSYSAVNSLKTTCDDLAGEYEHLAKSGADILGHVKTSIGLYYQYIWYCSYGDGYGGSQQWEEYHDNKPTWKDRWLWHFGSSIYKVEQVPHPDREKARQKLEETTGKVEDADEKFELDSKDVGLTVKSVGNFLGTWLEGYTQLSKIAFPETPEDIPTPSATSWHSPFVVDRYSRNVQLQYDAHVTTEETIAGLMGNCANYLEQMASHLGSFAELVRAQEDYYARLVTSDWIPDKTNMASFIDIIGKIGTAVVEFKGQQDTEAKAMIDVMISAVKDILRIEELRADIQGMSRSGDGGWPLPNEVGIAEPHGHSGDVLIFESQYFKDHIQTWEDLANDLYGVSTTVGAAPAISHMFLRWPAFGSTTGTAITSLGEDIHTDAVYQGSRACRQLSTKLLSTIRTYIAGEDLNETEAKKLEDILNG